MQQKLIVTLVTDSKLIDVFLFVDFAAKQLLLDSNTFGIVP